MGAPIGNTNSSKSNRLWAETIRRVNTQSEGERLRKIAEKLYELAEAGDMRAIEEIGDRMDGKVAQTLDLGSDPDRPIVTKVVREIVHPPNRDG